MIYKDSENIIHLIGYDMKGIRLDNGFIRHYNELEFENMIKLKSLIIKNKSKNKYRSWDSEYSLNKGFYHNGGDGGDSRLIFVSNNGIRVIEINKEGLKISHLADKDFSNIKRGDINYTKRNMPNFIKLNEHI